MSVDKFKRLDRRTKSVRSKVVGTTDRPRLTAHRTLKHIYAQVIDDSAQQTLAASSSVALKIAGGNAEAAKAVGKAVAEMAKGKNITKVCFDRSGRLYHGRIKALADGAREGGLEF